MPGGLKAPVKYCYNSTRSKAAEVQHMIAGAIERYGGLDYAFNNAGFVGSNAGIIETSEEDWHRVMATNLTGVWLCMKYEIPEMLKRGGGAIVNNGSAVGLVGAAGAVSNVASKHGVSGLTKSAALQFATQGIRVNAVAPGLVHTPLTDRITAARPAQLRRCCRSFRLGVGVSQRRSLTSSSFCARMGPPM
jgi:NAD(P)-dependent dehydrogenase (short-subunit alcohol dehydrogenase family)